MDLKYQTYCIAMQKEKEQRQRVQCMFDKQNIPFAFFDGIDGRNELSHEYMALLHPMARLFGHPSVIGCALSHFLLWKTLQGKKECDYFLICESDIEIPVSFTDKLQACLEESTNDFDILLIGNRNFDPADSSWVRKSCNRLFCGNKIGRQLSTSRYIPDIALATHCYMVNGKGLNRLIDYVSSKLGWHIDHIIQNSQSLRIEAVYPPLASQYSGMTSSIAETGEFPATLNYLFDTPIENGFSLSYWLNCPIAQICGIPLNLWTLIFICCALIILFCQIPVISVLVFCVTIISVDYICASILTNATSYKCSQLMTVFSVLSIPWIVQSFKKHI